MANEPNEQQWHAIEDELKAGRKIQAIKLFREITGSDLAEAKETVDRHESKLRQEFPDQFQKKSGCGAAVLLMGAAVTLLILIF